MEPNPKRENLLNLALDATPGELENAPDLRAGYEKEDDTWQLIVRHGGDLSGIRAMPGASVTSLLNNYAIITLPRSQIDALTKRTEIEYIEKPKQLFFSLDQGRRASCLLPLQPSDTAADGLTGKGVLCGIADSGIDWRHPDFCNPDGTTRILSIWDQTLSPDENEAWNAPMEYGYGVEFSQEQINLALEASAYGTPNIPQTLDSSGHGTHVAGIMAGNGRASNGRYRGVAYESGILAVRLGRPRENGFPNTVELMAAVDYLIRKALFFQRPISINLSFGNNYGSHNGTSLLETYLNSLSGYWKNTISVGTGNEGAASIHTSGAVSYGEPTRILFAVSIYEASLNVQLWKSYADTFSLELVHPSGQSTGTIRPIPGTQRYRIRGTDLLLFYGEPSPYSPYQEIYLQLLPVSDYIDSGIWEIRLFAERIVTGAFDLWLPGFGTLNSGTGFLNPTESATLTIPSTAQKVISVAAYDSRRNQPAFFSGRGRNAADALIKPDLAAPGVDIISASPGGGYTAKSGTSMATPFVSGSAALLMQWGIINGNDPFLYGEKAKAYLQKGAAKLPGFARYPNPVLGFGTLCVRDSIPDNIR